MNRREQWLRQTMLRLSHPWSYTFPPLNGQTEVHYCGKPLSDTWPTEEMMTRDFLRWEREDSGRLDTADPKTFEGWVKCADGRTLWEYAHDEGNKR